MSEHRGKKPTSKEKKRKIPKDKPSRRDEEASPEEQVEDERISFDRPSPEMGWERPY